MCDFSLQAAKSRPAAVGDKLITKNFGTGTRGFVSVDEATEAYPTAVCVLPGTELAFSEGLSTYQGFSRHNTARFRQINKDDPHAHHDALELPDGKVFLLTFLMEGQTATVLQLPKMETKEEIEQAKRVAFAG